MGETAYTVRVAGSRRGRHSWPVLRSNGARAADTKLARYRSALEAGTDPAIVSQWIREVEADRALARAQMDEHEDGPQRLEAEEIAAQLDQIGDIGDADRKARPPCTPGWSFD